MGQRYHGPAGSGRFSTAASEKLVDDEKKIAVLSAIQKAAQASDRRQLITLDSVVLQVKGDASDRRFEFEVARARRPLRDRAATTCILAPPGYRPASLSLRSERIMIQVPAHANVVVMHDPVSFRNGINQGPDRH